MSDIQRGLAKLLEDLDRRARPGRPSRYRMIQKLTSVSDTVYFSSDQVALTVQDTPYVWYSTTASSSRVLFWSLGGWA